ncbi:histidine--tRNA ligase, cytoplasmic [Coffea arabica]|uniref:Histidine--tRNA ligase, cytoplasmic n=1 Tax=Coffea arabica TaxID=13443 RepID=A0A6P6XFZ2_COFAR|nr:histidine--tRNA ligase, cytoplasmic-like [Coffea arabica]
MAAESFLSRVVRLGGEWLSSSSVFELANGLARLALDSSAISKLSSSAGPEVSFSIPDDLTIEETRASVLVLLNNLLCLSSSSAFAITQLYDVFLNLDESGPRSYKFQDGGVPQQNDVDYYSLAALDGISALLDHGSSALGPVADAVAALSCEALRADLSCFNLTDSGDGSFAKDDVAVASDFKVFFNGSKLVVNSKNPTSATPAISRIPAVYGNFREVCRLLHYRTRVQLSCAAFRAGSAEAMSTALSSLALALYNLADTSSSRAKLLLDSLPSDELRSILGAQRSSSKIDSIKQLLSYSQAALIDKDYIRSVHQIYCLLEAVRKTVCWEATVAFVSLEGGGIIAAVTESKNPPLSAPTGADKKKGERRKKVLGKGSSALMQFIKESLLSGDGAANETNSISASTLFEKWAQDFLFFLDPRNSRFEILLEKLKDIVASNESRRLPKLPKGTRDFAKEQMTVREKAFSIIVDVFKRHGATALDTPAFELRETLMGKYGEDSKLIYDLADQGGELCSLRYDLTVPFARYVAMNGLTSFKRYQIAKVYRRDNPSKGRFREFYQCDFDIAGQFEKMGPDFEVIKILTELLNELDIGDYEVKLNHRKLLDGMMAICGVPQEKFRTICSSIDKLDKQSFEQIKREMVNEKGLTEEVADAIGTFVKERGPPMELLCKLKRKGSEFLENIESHLALNELEILFKALGKAKCDSKVVFDLSLARGLDYYTGVIFEAVFKGSTQVGSIAAGGRYDNLVGMFGTKQVPAVGISLGIERVFVIMEQLQKDRNETMRATETEVLVSILGDDLSLGAELASELWDAKVKAEYMLDKRLMKHIGRARDSRIPWMLIVGENELSQGVVKLKDVVATKDYDIPRSRLVEEVCMRLNK